MPSRRLLAPAAADLPGADDELIARMLEVEVAWCRVLGRAGRVDQAVVDQVEAAAHRLREQDGVAVLLADGTDAGGNPVIPLIAQLRQGLQPVSDRAAWIVHRGLTSQDTLDTALMLIARDALEQTQTQLGSAVTAAATLADNHRDTLMIGRTLTQWATPTTFGLRAAGWLRGLATAADEIRRARGALPVQCGGAVGTLAAVAEVVPDADPVHLSDDLASELGLAPALPWHVDRGPVTRMADALASVTDAVGHIATDVTTLSRSEIGELSEPTASGRGGSSTLPGKRNPILSVEIRAIALQAPHDLAALHLASVLAVDERPDGAWHSEWSPLCRLLGAARTTTTLGAELLQGLDVHTETMRHHLDEALPGALAERAAMHEHGDVQVPGLPEDYLGASHQIIDRTLQAVREETSC